jgi:hypothetical protein
LNRITIFATLVTVLVCAPAPARAGTVLYGNFGPGYAGDSPLGYGAGFAFFGTTFTASAGGTLQQVEISIEDGPLNITGGLYTNSGGEPGTLLESWNISIPSNDDTITTLTSVVNPAIIAGTQYWFVLANPTVASFTWLANDDNVLGGSYGGSTLAGLSGGGNAIDPAPGIELMGNSSVPEPATGCLFGAGCLGLGLFKYRRSARYKFR